MIATRLHLSPLPDWCAEPDVMRLTHIFAQNQAEFRFIGGCVRDTLRGVAITDIDASSTLAPEAVMALLARHGIKALPTGIAHGTVTAVLANRHIEITTLRRDLESHGRHAKVAFTHSWEEDTMRRDFTINAMSLTAEGILYDYTDGLRDLKAGRVRFIGDADARIQEDYLRILRFFRFHGLLGGKPIDKDALAACARHRQGINGLSGERIQTEMLKLLSLPAISPTLAAMHKTGIWVELCYARLRVSHFRFVQEIEKKLSRAPNALLRLAWLLKTLPRPEREKACDFIISRWKCSRVQAEQLRLLALPPCRIHAAISTRKLRRYIRFYGKELVLNWIILAWASACVRRRPAHRFHAFIKETHHWKAPAFPITGADLLALGLKEGAELGKQLAALESLWEKKEYRPTKMQLLAYVSRPNR